LAVAHGASETITIKMMDTNKLEKKLAAAQERLGAAVKALAPKHKGGEWEEFAAAEADVLMFERELAHAKGEEYAVVSDFPIKWDIGAPLPHVIANEYRTLLIFYVREIDPNWDGTYVTVKDPAEECVQSLALVEIKGCVSFRMGTPNDEVLEGHPLSGKGLDEYTAQVVKNSKWITELEAINKVHSCYREDRWRKLTRYILWFHDSTFECVAESYEVEVESVSNLLAKACGRLLE
jgi:hypothetical protein